MKNIIYIIFILFIANSCTNENQVKIGVLMPMTGDAGSYGQKGEKAIRLANELANDNEDKQFVPIFEDSKAEPTAGVSAATKLINADRVNAIVGDIVSSVTLAVAPICENKEIVLIAPTSSAPAITEAGEFIYRVWPSDLAEGKAAGEYAKRNGYNTVSILHLNNDYGNSIVQIFKENYVSDSTKIELSLSYDKDQSDFKSILSQVASGSELIYIAGYYNDIARILIQAKQLGIKSQFMGVTAIEDDEFIKIAGSAANGIIYPLASGYSPDSNESLAKEFTSKFEEKFGYTPGWVEAHCFDAYNIIIEAYRDCNNCTGQTLQEYIEKKKEFTGVTGIIKFDKNGDVMRPVIFKTVQDGEFVKLN